MLHPRLVRFDGGENAVGAEGKDVASVLRFDRACDALLLEPPRARHI